MKKLILTLVGVLGLFAIFTLIHPSDVFAHCDTLDGPVVAAARKSFDKDNVNYVLVWVKPEEEEEIKKAFKKAKNKKKLAKTKKDMEKAEMEFFETLVRVHREGEGVTYQGIKPAGKIDPELALADKVIESGNLDKILEHIKSTENKKVITHLFHKLQKRSSYDTNDVSAGREYIEAYVIFIHAVESVLKEGTIEISHLHSH